MRHPLKSYNKTDSYYNNDLEDYVIGENDKDLMYRLMAANDPSHYKFLRMIQVWVDVTLPRYVWSEWDTYRIGTTSNSQSTMHRLIRDGVTADDLEYEWGFDEDLDKQMLDTIDTINHIVDLYKQEGLSKEEKEKYFLMAKSFLPECYKQTRMVNLNYQVLRNMYHQRKNHRLPQWHDDFTRWVKTLPMSELITDFWNKG